MPRSITINLYTINELTGKAKERARDWCRDMLRQDPPWQTETFESQNAVLDWLGRIPDDAEGKDVLSWLEAHKGDIAKECPFTGYCADEDALKPVRLAMKRMDATDRDDLIQEVVKAIDEAWDAEMEAIMSDAYIDEHIALNGHEFTEDGDLS